MSRINDAIKKMIYVNRTDVYNISVDIPKFVLFAQFSFKTHTRTKCCRFYLKLVTVIFFLWHSIVTVVFLFWYVIITVVIFFSFWNSSSMFVFFFNFGTQFVCNPRHRNVFERRQGRYTCNRRPVSTGMPTEKNINRVFLFYKLKRFWPYLLGDIINVVYT